MDEQIPIVKLPILGVHRGDVYGGAHDGLEGVLIRSDSYNFFITLEEAQFLRELLIRFDIGEYPHPIEYPS